MKKMKFAAVCLTALTLFMSVPAPAQQNGDNWGDNPGVWSADIFNDRVHVQFGGLHWSSSASFQLSELGTLPTGTPGTFTVKRDPGSVTFNGIFAGGQGHGTYAFAADPSFKSYLESEGFKEVSGELMIHLFFTNINKTYFAYMKDNGYQGITMDQLKDLAYQNVNQRVMTGYLDLFKKENYGKVSLEQIVELREHGVTPEFISEMKKAGARNVSLDEAIELRDHGVTSAFIQGFRDLGYTDLSLEKATELVDHGVTVEFIREFQRLGFKDVTPDKAQELRDHGVTAEFIKKMQDKGLKNLSLDGYVRLRDSGM